MSYQLFTKRAMTMLGMFLFCTTVFSQNYVEKKHYETNPRLGGDVVIKSLSKEVKGNSSYSVFEINVPTSGNYYVNFWLCPAKLPNGRFTEYDVLVNDKNVGKIKPKKSDWQAISLDGNKTIQLEGGSATIAVMGSVPEIPNVEFVRLSKEEGNARISDTAYRNYKNEITEISQQRAKENANDIVSDTDTLDQQLFRQQIPLPLNPQTNPPYDADFLLGLNIRYTFYTIVDFVQGQNISLTTTGIDNFEHVLELFLPTSMQNSWVARSNASCQAALNITVPETGSYYVRVRSYRNARLGMCNLNINNAVQYDSVAVYSYGIRGEKDTQTIYNSFTCYNNGDPRIWVEEAGVPGIITAINDDYDDISEDYNWGYNARVKKQYSSLFNAILLSVWGSNDPYCTCDVYCNCISAYENLSDNFIQSAPATGSYNCAAWAGGVYSAWIWPPSDFSGPERSPLETFDLYFDTLRYVGCSTFSRQGATDSNSVIDLWKVYDTDTAWHYTHTSVRKGADNNAHGYDWESKLGNLTRLYHPRNHVPMWSYGFVCEHYRRVDTGLFSSLEEAIANGRAAYENVHFTQEEGDYIELQIKRIPLLVLSHFYVLYGKWNETWYSSPFSDPDMIADCDEYRELLAYCRNNELLKYAVYKILDEGNVNAICPVKDLTLEDNRALLAKVFEDNRKRPTNDKGVRIFRTMQSNAMLYVKELLREESGRFGSRNNDLTGINYSNNDDFSIQLAGESIVLMFALGNSSRIYADVIDMDGKVIGTFVGNKMLQPDSYMYQCNVPKGIYLVRYIVNGNVNVKKINVI